MAWAEFDQRPERHQIEVQSSRGDVLAHVSRCDCEFGSVEVLKEPGRDEVNPAAGWEAGPAEVDMAC